MFNPPAPTSDKAIVMRRLTSAKGKATVARNNREKYELRAGRPMWEGERTPAWDAWIDLTNACANAESRVLNLTALLNAEYVTWSSRNIAFDNNDELIIDGAWVCDLDSNGQELCLECARMALMTGSIHVDSCHPYLLSVGDPDYTVTCSFCGKELYHVDEEEIPSEDAQEYADSFAPTIFY